MTHTWQCLGTDQDGSPYGWDPVLLSTSTIYNGKVTYDSAYRPSEKAPSQFFDAAFGEWLFAVAVSVEIVVAVAVAVLGCGAGVYLSR